MTRDEALEAGWAACEQGIGSCGYETDVERGFCFRFMGSVERVLAEDPGWLEKNRAFLEALARQIGERATQIACPGGDAPERPVSVADINQAVYYVSSEQEMPTRLC